MATDFITVLNGVITGQHCGDIDADFFGTPYYGHDRIIIPQGVMVSNSDKIEFYDEKWQRKTDLQLIDEGLLPAPEGYVNDGGVFRKMSAAERVAAGLEELPSGYRIENGVLILMTQIERIAAGLEEVPSGQKIEGDKLIPMTLEERLEAGQITQDEYDNTLAAANTAELRSRLEALQTPEETAQAFVDENYAAELKAKMIALLDVKKQPGWPVTVEWPE